MGEAIAFYTLAAFILGFAVLVVSTKDTVHSVLFLVLDFLFVAALYVLLAAPFLAVIQILVYAGGIVVLYLFVVMLASGSTSPDETRFRARGRRAPGACCDRPVSIGTAHTGRRGGNVAGFGQHGTGGLAALHELFDPFRNRVDAAAGRDDRRHSVGEERIVRRRAS
jgi:NADH-ubiquinone/plastoquinone oxidoreductase chain 6